MSSSFSSASGGSSSSSSAASFVFYAFFGFSLAYSLLLWADSAAFAPTDFLVDSLREAVDTVCLRSTLRSVFFIST
jgi:hypothetical protein